MQGGSGIMMRAAHAEVRACVRLMLCATGNTGWVVKTAIKGSPAEMSGKISEGDMLAAVDGVPVDKVYLGVSSWESGVSAGACAQSRPTVWIAEGCF